MQVNDNLSRSPFLYIYTGASSAESSFRRRADIESDPVA